MPNPPNKPIRLRPLREDVRSLETDGDSIKGAAGMSGGAPDIAQHGYVRTCRRPRLRGFNEIVETEQADRIEGYMKGSTPFMYGDE